VPDADSLPDRLDSVLRKYGKIWIWSILSAAVAALSMRSLATAGVLQMNAFNVYGGHSQTNASFIFLWLVTIAPAIATLVSVCYLLLFLRHHILPILFPPPPAEPFLDIAPDTIPDGARLLYRAFAAVVVAMGLEIAISLASIIFRALA
jgi:hypothetical protein